MELLLHIAIILTVIYTGTIVLFMAGLKIRRHGGSPERPGVSVIIAARNEESNIKNILTDLAGQSYPKELYEVIIANDFSNDKTAEIVKQYSAQYPQIKLLDMQTIPAHYSPKKWAIQSAVGKAAGEIILVTDADCRVGSKWIEGMATYFEPDVGFVIGFSQFGARGEQQNLIERYQAFDFVTLMGAAAGTTNLGFPLAASGQNLGYRKSTFQQIGGYQKVAHRVSGDDVLLLQLVRKHTKQKIVFAANPDTYAVSEPQPTLKAFINQRKRWASNGSIQMRLNFGFFLYLMQVLLYNAVLLVGLTAALVIGRHLDMMLLCLATRVLSEFAIAVKSAFYFNRADLLKYFPLWVLSQMPYIVCVGLAGTFGKFRWKEREHSARIPSTGKQLIAAEQHSADRST